MGMEKSIGIMEKQNIKENSLKGRKMGKVGLNGKMAVFMKAALLKECSKVMESTSLQIWISGMKENSEWEIWKEKERKAGMMEGSMKVISREGRRMEKGHLNGQMGTNTLGVGKTINNMALAYTTMQRKETKDKESRKIEKGLNGLIELIILIKFI